MEHSSKIKPKTRPSILADLHQKTSNIHEREKGKGFFQMKILGHK